MAFISRVTGWFERFLDMSDGDDEFEPEASDGFLMTAPGEAPPVLPEFRAQVARLPTPIRAPAIAPESEPDADLADEPFGEDEGPTPVSDVEREVAPPKVIVLPTLDAKPEAFVAPAAKDAEPVDVVEGTAPEPAAELVAIQSAAATAPTEAAEPTVVEAGSVEDMLTMFRAAGTETEFHDLTKDLEDVTAQELLEEARMIRDILVPAGGGSEDAA